MEMENREKMSKEIDYDDKSEEVIWEEKVDEKTGKKIYVGITENEIASFLIEETQEDGPVQE